MKTKFFSIIFVALMLCISSYAQKTYAIITGVSNYEGTSNDLTQSTKDAKNLAMLYKSKGATVILLTSKHATRDNVVAAIRKIQKMSTASDRIIFSYSGHGVENRMCTYASDASKMLSYSDLFRELSECKAQRIVCFIDACFSGTAVRGIQQGNSRFVVYLSSRSDETSAENPLVGSGLLTNAVLKGLRGKADANADKNVTVMELFKYIHKDVQLHNKKQHPQLVTSKTLYDQVLMNW